ncbi:NAD-dependent epimerase/dehydratase family protein [Alkalihalobacillus pseudalcaliphilus]|uniref:NAD-dependent epimerase/dehydratase family protein n=1 Tax=Alkalihalobacillus pseudalcaliphilus TaxID=79884 RepID=UPI00064D7FD9|nr:NAD(P)-dependent oxidoreductase [Alkalihalobacillus pseudalcaliphilus]KMK74774.1 UDP-glucose 4-epimerase [Alkalihalobacillus pseudalcaliphilus]
MKKVVITGGLGFIGFHLSQRLLENGYEVIAIDERQVDRQKEREEMQMRLGRNALYKLIEEKIEEVDLKEVINDADVVFHFAALTKHDNKWPRLQEVISRNVLLTKEVIKNMSKSSRFIFPSTVQVYGERPGLITEKTPTNPTTAYGITKLASETLIMKLANELDLSYLIFRLPTIYGPFQRTDMTYQQFLNGVEQPNMDRSQMDVVYIDDVIDAFMLSVTTSHTNEIFHIATGKLGEWQRGVELLGHKWTAKSGFKTTLSTEKAKQLLGFEVQTSLEEGIQKQVEHEKQMNQNNWSSDSD